MTRLSILALLLPFALAAPARAQLAEGDVCKLRKNVDAKLRNDTRGEMHTELEAGTELVIERPGRAVMRVTAGEVSALVETEVLEAACFVDREVCKLTAPVKMATGISDARKIFKVKAGAEVVILRRGSKRTDVQVGELIGQMNSSHLKQSCRPVKQPTGSVAAAEETAQLRLPRPPAGVTGAVLPFAFAKQVNPMEARMFHDQLGDSMKAYRSDVMLVKDLGQSDKTLQRDLKAHVEASRDIARRMGLSYFITGHLSGRGSQFALALSVVDVKSGRLLKGVKARPTVQAGDPWAEHAAGFIQEVLPGGKPYEPPKKTEAADPTEPQQTRTAGGGSYEGRPFYLNGLAWTALGTAAVLAGGGAATGFWASTDVEPYTQTPRTNGDRQEIGNFAMAKAVVADSLFGASIVAVTLSLVFFVTGIDGT